MASPSDEVAHQHTMLRLLREKAVIIFVQVNS